MSQDNKKSFVMYQGDGSNNVFSVPMTKGKYGTISVAFVRRGLDQYEYNPDTWGLNGCLFAWDLSGVKVYTDTATPAIGATIYDQYGVDTGDIVTAVGGATITVNTNVYTRDTLHDVDENTVLTWTGDTLQVGDYIVIERTTTRTQPFEFQNNQKHIEKSDDNLERQIQEVADKVDNALLVDPTYTIDSNKMNPVEWMKTILRSVDKSVRGFRYLNGWLDYSLDDPNIADVDKTWTHLVNTDNIKAIREQSRIENNETIYYTEYLAQDGSWKTLSDPHKWDNMKLSDLADVDFTNLSAGNFIMFDGLKWKNVFSSATAGWGTILGNIADQTDLKDALDAKVNIDGTSIMTAPLKFASGSMRGAVGPYLNGISFWKMDSQGTITNIANLTDSRFLPVTTNAIDIGRSTNKWKDLYLGGKAHVGTINNGADITVPTTSGTMALLSDIPTYKFAINSTDTERNLTERFNDFINVKDFGAKGDGATDDTAAINDALTAANGLKQVFFPAGTYLTTGNLSSLYLNETVGDGYIKRENYVYYVSPKLSQKNTLYVSASGTGDGLSPTSATSLDNAITHVMNKRVLDGYWEINLAAGTYTGPKIISDITVLRDGGFVFVGEEPDRVNNTWGTKINRGTTLNASLMFDGVNRIKVKNLWINSDYDGSENHALYFTRCGKCNVENCYLTNFTGGGVSVQVCKLLGLSNCIIDGDTTNNTNTHGIGIYVYNCFFTSLIQDGTVRTTIKNVGTGLSSFGSSYCHNDYNDFDNCNIGISCTAGGYSSSISCTYTNCNTDQRIRGIGQTQTDVAYSSNSTKRYHSLCTMTNYNDTHSYWSQGYFYPDCGTNGTWAIGYKEKYTNFNSPVSLCFSSDGSASNRHAEGLTNGLFFESKDRYIEHRYVSPTYIMWRFLDNSENIPSKGLTFRTDSSLVSLETSISGNKGYRFTNASFECTDEMTLGSASRLWGTVYSTDGTINTSDERKKQEIKDIDERVFKAWAKVEFKQFLFKSSYEKKGDNARIHIGLIAQQVKAAFESEGLDGFKYGLLCYDEWDDAFEEREVVDEPAEYDESGCEIKSAKTHIENKLVKAAGNAYGIRYSEALALECAYQRWLSKKLEKRLNKLENDEN